MFFFNSANMYICSYQYKRLEGTFLKTTAIQTAIDLIEVQYFQNTECTDKLVYQVNHSSNM